VILAILLNAGGVLLLLASSFAVLWNRRIAVPSRPATWRRLWSERWPLGLLLALLSVFSGAVRYEVTIDGRTHEWGGIPFLVGQTGADLCGNAPCFIFGTQLNFLFWLLIPQFVLWATSRLGSAPP
jgi:hypothetical protein